MAGDAMWQARAPAGPAGLPRVLAAALLRGGRVSLAEHRTAMASPPAPGTRPNEWLLLEVEAAGLHGRGGAAFPTSVKLRAVAGRHRRPVVVVNGSEGEPASSKDHLLLVTQPHLVLDGAIVAAAAVGADRIVVGIDVTETDAHASVVHALEERRSAEPIGPDVEVVAIPHRYVAGEERSLVRLIGGGPAIPTSAPTRPFERGVDGRPTLVQNVETLAHLAQIANYGAGWFRELGTEGEPGSRLLTVSGAVARPGVYEVAIGTPVANVLASAGGAPQDVSAVLSGGYFGTWLRPERALPARLSDADLRDLGASLGSGVVVFLSKGVCGLAESARVATWFSRQTADQCGPCVHGLAAIGRGVSLLARRQADGATVDRLLRWAGDVEGRGACRLPDGAVRFVRSALTVFADEVARHRAGDCSASVHEPALPLGEVRP